MEETKKFKAKRCYDIELEPYINGYCRVVILNTKGVVVKAFICADEKEARMRLGEQGYLLGPEM